MGANLDNFISENIGQGDTVAELEELFFADHCLDCEQPFDGCVIVESSNRPGICVFCAEPDDDCDEDVEAEPLDFSDED